MIGDKEQKQLPQPPLQEIEQFLEQQSGISSTDRGQRSILIRKRNYIFGPNIHEEIKQPLPLSVRVSQNYISGKWDAIEVSVDAPIPNPLQGEHMAKVGLLHVLSAQGELFGDGKRAGRIVLRRGKPFTEISFSPTNTLGRMINLDKQKWVTSMRDKNGRDLPPYTTDDDKEAAKIVGFILRAGSETTVEKR